MERETVSEYACSKRLLCGKASKSLNAWSRTFAFALPSKPASPTLPVGETT
jgi:hypothetical protein